MIQKSQKLANIQFSHKNKDFASLRRLLTKFFLDKIFFGLQRRLFDVDEGKAGFYFAMLND
jgi:hypothetical protein